MKSTRLVLATCALSLSFVLASPALAGWQDDLQKVACERGCEKVRKECVEGCAKGVDAETCEETCKIADKQCNKDCKG